ncbi:MAG: D-alanine--D-alanine ligase family protein [Dermabacter sp.]|nr:D-alanine--D-alanine ligase family protein [Dermabacter sp.]
MITVALLFGGRSGEHGISCVTAGSILRQIDRTRFRVLPIGITTEGAFVEVSDDPDRWQIVDGAAPSVPSDGDEIILQPPGVSRGPVPVRVVRDGGRIEHLADVDVVFPLLHGPYGEDGTVQGFLELFDLPYVGSGVLASAAAQDKDITKRLLREAGLRVADGIVVSEREWEDPDAREAAVARMRDLAPPLFVKPARSGSSIGVSKIDGIEQLEGALASAFAIDSKVLVEAGLSGREVECGVLESADGGVRTSEPGEIVIGDDLDFYDYASKYFGAGSVSLQVPAALSPELSAAVQEVAARAHRALGLDHLSRVDTFVTDGGEVVVNEVNTMPGFTQSSMFPVLWDAMGLAYPDLIATLITLALEGRGRASEG